MAKARAATGRFPYRDHRSVAELQQNRGPALAGVRRIWCSQCDAMVGVARAVACTSTFCPIAQPDVGA
ncbi:hypothetical protein [Sphingomonas hengshuiensis]|uniref:hypothetical protein n=1 Tax=Sphingomonas hengshuiensis TaxID=1609977 RepID=UPI0012B80C7F|nr:hypothetical protein [Sphingomonas hengshuiensis]